MGYGEYTMEKHKHEIKTSYPVNLYHRLKLRSILDNQPMSRLIVGAVSQLLDNADDESSEGSPPVSHQDVLVACANQDAEFDKIDAELKKLRESIVPFSLNKTRTFSYEYTMNGKQLEWVAEKEISLKKKKRIEELLAKRKKMGRAKQGRPVLGEITNPEIIQEITKTLKGEELVKDLRKELSKAFHKS